MADSISKLNINGVQMDVHDARYEALEESEESGSIGYVVVAGKRVIFHTNGTLTWEDDE